MSDVELELDKVYETPVHATYIKHRHEFVQAKHAVYGEILRESVDIIIDMFPERFSEGNVFYDIGCGTGKFVSHVALKTKVSKSIGIELADIRVAKAREIISQVNYGNTVPVIRQENLFEADYSDATIVYFDTTMFSPDELREVAGKLPEGCLIIYKDFLYLGEPDGSFVIATSYKPEGAPFAYKVL